MSARMTVAASAHRKAAESVQENNPDLSDDAPVLAMAEALAASDAITYSPANIDRAAEALWNRAPPVIYRVRPRWAKVKDDPEWARPVAVTRADAKTVADTLAAVR